MSDIDEPIMMEMDDEEDVTVKALASVTKFLQQCTSPQLGKLSRESDASSAYLPNTDWMEDVAIIDPPRRPSPPAPHTPLRHQRSTPLLERAHTPIMSNSSSKQNLKQAEAPPTPVETPAPKSRPTPATTLVTTYSTSLSSSSTSYHDALWHYVLAKRQLSQRLALAQQQAALEEQTTMPKAAAAAAVSSSDTRLEVEFLSRLPGDAWALLARFRSLGLDAVLWRTAQEDDAGIAQELQRLQRLEGMTPASKLRALQDSPVLAIQRLRVLQAWLEASHSPKHVGKRSKPVSDRMHPDDVVPALGQDDEDMALLEACLELAYAGRWSDAQALCRAQGRAWRAAAWAGGQAHDDNGSRDSGNPRRFLWKRQVYRAAEATKGAESVLYGLLSGHVQAAWTGREGSISWKQALYALVTALWGRWEDIVLQNGSPAAHEQLVATANLSNTLSRAMDHLPRHLTPNVVVEAMIRGQTTMLQLCEDVQESSDDDLAFATHLVLYLDSLQVATNPVDLGVNKDDLLWKYVQVLAREPAQWFQLPLYASLLPAQRCWDWYPTILVQVGETKDRQRLLEECSKVFDGEMRLKLIQRTVRLGMWNDDLDDATKCAMIEWLLLVPEWRGEALIASNLLLRCLFDESEDDKIDVATKFVENYLPADLLEGGDGDDSLLETHKGEHEAFVCYLDASNIFGDWKACLENASTAGKDDRLNTSNLNSTERQIALEYQLTQDKKESTEQLKKVLEAAEKASKSLHIVMTYPGGWLLLDVEEDGDKESQQRRRQLADIRSKYLVLAVQMYLEVCEDTAAWLGRRWEVSAGDWYQRALDMATLVADDTYGIHTAFGALELQEFLSKLAETAVSQLMLQN